MKIFTQAVLKGITFENYEYSTKLCINNINNFVDFIKGHELFKTVKPRIYFLFELEYLIKKLSSNSTLTIISDRVNDPYLENIIIVLKNIRKYYNINISRKINIIEDKSYILFEDKFCKEKFTSNHIFIISLRKKLKLLMKIKSIFNL